MTKPQTPDDAITLVAKAIKAAFGEAFFAKPLFGGRATGDWFTDSNAGCINLCDVAQAALAADPLRLALGPAAIQAILDKSAAVVPIEDGSGWVIKDVKYSNGVLHEFVSVSAMRLDQPTLSKTETAQNHTEDMLDMVSDHVGDANDMMPAKGDDTNSPVSIVSDEQSIQTARGDDAFKKPENLNTSAEHAQGVNISTEGEGI